MTVRLIKKKIKMKYKAFAVLIFPVEKLGQMCFKDGFFQNGILTFILCKDKIS